jgi:hypothetical protein
MSWIARVSSLWLLTWAFPASGSGGLMDDERLLYSTGTWHRLQRKRVTFESACYYTHEIEMPHGCQYDVMAPEDSVWRVDAVRSTQRAALLSFWESTGGKNWRTVDNWGNGDPCWDAWYGVTCDEHGHVIAIELVDNYLIGIIPEDINQITSLLKLDVSTTASDYHNHVNRFANHISGVLPSLAAISRLEELTIAGNHISGLPGDLYLNGDTLRLISGSYNQITALPKYLNRFKALHTLELDHNYISGMLAPDIGYMAQVRYIHLDTNYFSGPVPESLSQLTRIKTFDVSHNPLLGSEVSEDIIVNWVDVEYLAILNTSITGYIASLCLDVPFCWKYMFDTHKDMSWVTAAEVPDIVNMTIQLAKTNAEGPQWLDSR